MLALFVEGYFDSGRIRIALYDFFLFENTGRLRSTGCRFQEADRLIPIVQWLCKALHDGMSILFDFSVKI